MMWKIKANGEKTLHDVRTKPVLDDLCGYSVNIIILDDAANGNYWVALTDADALDKNLPSHIRDPCIHGPVAFCKVDVGGHPIHSEVPIEHLWAKLHHETGAWSHWLDPRELEHGVTPAHHGAVA